ncbi:MAG: hypothetical protein JW891_12570 [Candidatus Lokiarchaeota archaeon]|nr:hypothetical protein [Candidatus Lokiarchaeota archaeon]
MPLRILWKSNEYLPFALMMLGACGLYQWLFIFVAQYLLHIGDYLIILVIPIAITGALFLSTKILFEGYAQVKRRKKLKNQFMKKGILDTRAQKILAFPISKPLLIVFALFTGVFIATYAICAAAASLDVILSFLISENVGAICCIFFANYFERNYAKIRKF